MSMLPVSLLRGALDSAWVFTWRLWTPDLLLSLALAGVLAMHLTLKREIAAQAKRGRRMEAMLLRLRDAGSAAAGVDQSHAILASDRGDDQGFDTHGDTHALAMAPPGLRSGMNVSRRVQALRLLRRGENLDYIATALGVPRCEIELLVRVHRLAVAGTTSAEHTPAPEPSRAPPARFGLEGAG